MVLEKMKCTEVGNETRIKKEEEKRENKEQEEEKAESKKYKVVRN